MYEIRTKSYLDKKLKKLAKKNPKQLRMIYKKIVEVSNNPHHFMNLRRPLQHLKRIHIDKHFVLVFSVDDKQKIVVLKDFDHHDNIYKHRTSTQTKGY